MSRILLIEKNTKDAEKLSALLAAINHQTRAVDTREKAEEWIALENFDSIITDATLEDGSYHDILRFTKRRKNYHDVAWIILSPDTTKEAIQQIQRTGVKYIFQHPLNKKVLEQVDNIFNPKVKYTYPQKFNEIIDMNSSLQVMRDKLMTTQLFDMLGDILIEDKQELEELYSANNVAAVDHILDKLEGSFQCCIVPTLALARTELHQAIKGTQDLTTAAMLFNVFYKEIERFLTTYEKICAQI